MNHQKSCLILLFISLVILKIGLVTGLECYICGTQSLPDSLSSPELMSMRPDPCWETDSQWAEYSVPCGSEESVCVKIVTRRMEEGEGEEGGKEVVHIQRSCTRFTMNFHEHQHRIGCGPLRSLNTDTFYSDGVACFCDTDFCNSGRTLYPTFSTIVLLIIVLSFFPNYLL